MPPAVVHSVHFYERDEALIQRLGTICLASFDAQKPVFLVVTDEHRRQMNTFFRKRGVDPYSLERRGLLIVLDAATLLSRFFKRGKLNPRLCRTTILKLLDSVTDSTGQAVPGTTVFGEMVAILWQQGREQVALELEAIWNELLEKRDFHLHCGYPKHLFGPMHSAEISSICDHHSISFGLASAA